jgi:hypothetical protein
MIRDLRYQISKALGSKANLECGLLDVILSGGRGYRLGECITVRDGEQPGKPSIANTGRKNDDPNGPNHDDPNGLNSSDLNFPNDEFEAAGARRNWTLQELGKGQKLRAPDVQRECGCSLTTAKRDLAALKEEGRIEFVGTRRTGHYRLKERHQAPLEMRQATKPIA